jgi:hypothetical protein
MAGLAPPRVAGKLVPVFSPRATKAGTGVRGPQLRPAPRYRDHRGPYRDRDQAVRAGGLRCGDLDLQQREITVRGKGGKDRIARSATRPPAAWTDTCAPAPGTPTPGGPSCGWELTTGSR